jgi:hypothetical protein
MKYGSVYREHNNKSKRFSIGDVKYETYNRRAKRGELIIWFDKNLAPDMAEKAASDQELDWSMSMRLPFDRCSICNNKARNRKQYCQHLRLNMKGYDRQAQKYAYARNEDGVKFVDISEVEKKADRIASYLRYISSDDDTMQKAASGELILGGAALHEAIYGIQPGIPVSIFEQLVLEKIAGVTADIPQAVLRSFRPRELSQAQIDVLREADFRSVAGQMLKKAMVLPPYTFAAMLSGEPIDAIIKDASFAESLQDLSNIMRDVASSGVSCCNDELATHIEPDPYGTSFCAAGDKIDRMIADVGENLGMTDEAVCGRAGNPDAGMSVILKAASASDNSNMWREVVNAYGYYLTKAAYELQEKVSIFNLYAMCKSLN